METKPGSFIYLQTQKKIDPNDQEEYDRINWNFLTQSVTFGVFCLFWARFYELGKYKLMVPNRLMYYVIVAGAPAIGHAFYRTQEIQSFLDQMDNKYTKQYFDLVKLNQ